MNKSGGLKTNSRFDSLKGSDNATNSFTSSTRYREDARPMQDARPMRDARPMQDARPMRTRGAYGSQTRGSYAPPQARDKQTSSNLFVAARKEPKKEFSSDAAMFPTLGEMKAQVEPTKVEEELGFAAALKRKKKTKKKKKEGKIMNAEPGWVVMYFDEIGKIQRKYGEGASEIDERPPPNREAIMRNMVARWQHDRDYMNETHGQLSPYYGARSLIDIMDDSDSDNWEEYDAAADEQPDDTDDGDY
jgi:hypothetical protein